MPTLKEVNNYWLFYNLKIRFKFISYC
jgi:hypothetical protein